jgi:mono/diheme cytochrome c family protein
MGHKTALVAGAAVLVGTLSMGAQERTAGEGVYAAAQATRGAAVFQTSCATCHQADGIAPSLTGDRFERFWTDANLNSLFTQIKTAMPRNAPGSLSEAAYVDVVAHLLAQNGFPPGDDELVPAAMAGVRIATAGATAGAVPDFALVQVVGCLAEGTNKTWSLRSATEPVRTREPEAPAESETSQLDANPIGTRSFRLLQVYSAPKGWSGQRVVAKGFLVRSGSEERMTVTSMRPLTSPCAD